MNLSDILDHHAARFGDATALTYADRDVSWDALRVASLRTAGALRALGVGRGDIVGVLLHNSDRFIEVMHAVSHVGAVLMPLNWRLAPPELTYILEHSTASVLVTEAEFADALAAVRVSVGCAYVAVGDEVPDGWQSLDAQGDESLAGPAEAMAADDLLRLMYTSGTTSRPKGVMLTYGNLLAKCAAHIAEYRLTHDAIGLACGPLYHVGTLDMLVTNLMYLGAPNHVLRRFDAGRVLEAIERHRITHVWLAPAMVRAVVDHPDAAVRDLSSVRMIIDGGEKMPLPLIDRVLDAFPNAWFADAYGLTETMSGDTFLDKDRERHKLGSVGRAVLHTEIRVVDDVGADVAPGTPGEILVRGPKTFAGYWRDEQATAAAFRDGWFRTGDLGTLDDDGYLFVVDRLKDVIVSGGENIASSEVERVIYELDDVAEAAVVAVPDERWNEVPVAFVALAAGATCREVEIVTHCRERLAPFKVPTAVHVVERLPRNPSGKVLKRTLREHAAEGGTHA